MTDLPVKACWTAEAAREILQTEALANREGAFLAVHQPIIDFTMGGTHGSDVDEATDESLLRALARPQNRHAFCVVEGEPGSGKSHLIRWLKVKWPGQDLVLLIQRADGSLPGALRELKNALGEEYGQLFDRLGHRLAATFEGRVQVFQRTLAASMAQGHFEQSLEDADECAKHELANLLDSAVVQNQWKGPERVLGIMAGAGEQRDQQVARFNLYDMAELGQLQPSVRDCTPRAMMFLRRLYRESRTILMLRDDGKTPEQALTELEDEVPYSRLLMTALNRRRDYAVQNVLGISVDGLKEIFLALRRRLKEEGRRLVLLLEDITAWEGLDSQLIDVLVTDSSTRQAGDLCDLVSVIGLTPRYMSDLQGNYLGRITHRVTLGRVGERAFYETSQLTTAESRERFATNYLRAVRAGLKTLDEWKDSGAQPAQVPNRCASCPVRESCHASFGAVDGIGLYPFTSQALTRIYEALSDPSGRMLLKTPRGMIQGVLSPVLLAPDALDERAFPPYDLQASDWLPEDTTRASSMMLQQIQPAAGNDQETADRLRRLIMLWGDPDTPFTSDDNGTLQFAGIARGVFDSFGLPWPGESASVQEATVAQEKSRPSEMDGGAADMAASLAPDETTTKSRQPRTSLGTQSSGQESGRQPKTSDSQRAVIKKQWQTMVAQLSAWRDGERLADLPAWERLLAELVRGLPRHRLGVSEALFNTLFTANNIKFESEARSDVRLFMVPKTEWLLLGLEAHIMLTSAQELPRDEEEELRRLHARMMRRLAEATKAHLQRRLPTLDNGDIWPMAASAAQILLARAWLRGETRPDRPLVEQFTCLLNDEKDATTNPRARVDSWQEILTRTHRQHLRLRTTLRRLLSLPQGDARSYGLADAGAVAAALREMQQTLRLWPAPGEVGKGLDELALMAELAVAVDGRLKQLPRYEGGRLTGSAQTVLAMLRGHSLRAHAERLDTVVAEVARFLPQAAPDAVKEWRTSYSRASSEGFFDERDDTPARRVEEFLLETLAEADDEPETSAAQRLSRLIAAPAAEVRQTRDLFELGEAAVRRSYAYAHDYVSTSGDGDAADPERVRQFGRQVHLAATSMRENLEKRA